MMNNYQATKRDLIRDKAASLFSNKGFQNTTISEIAKATNISEAGIYEHFKNKEDLLFSIPEKNFSDLMKSLESHLLGVKGPENQLRKFIWHHLSFLQERIEFTRLFILELWCNRRFYKNERSAPLEDYYNFFRKIVKDGIVAEVYREDFDLMIFQAMFFGTINHFVLPRLMLNKTFSLLSLGEPLEQLLFNAIRNKSNKEMSLWGKWEKKEIILQAAMDEFSANGYSQTTISQIASRAGITDPTLYEYFNSKEELLMSIPEEALKKFTFDLRENMRTINSPENHLKLFLWNQVKSCDNYPSYYKLLLGELRCNSKFYKSKAHEFIREYSKELLGILKSGVKSGYFIDNISISLIRDMYFGTTDQVLLDSMLNSDRWSLSEKIPAIYDLFINAIRKEKDLAYVP